MKEYGSLLGTPKAKAFSKRVFDVHEFIEDHGERLPKVAEPADWSSSVVIQDPCHLRHVQKAHDSVRLLLERFGHVAVLDDDGLCCGSGGSFSLQHPDLAVTIKDRKQQSIERSGAQIVASANPGCAGFLRQEGTTIEHPMVLVARALGVGPEGPNQ